MNDREVIIKFFEFLESRELCVFHRPTLTDPTEKGIQYLIDDFIQYLKETEQ